MLFKISMLRCSVLACILFFLLIPSCGFVSDLFVLKHGCVVIFYMDEKGVIRGVVCYLL